MSLPVKVYSALLESLYSATLGEAQWQDFLSRLCDITRSVIAFLVRNDNAIGRRFLASAGSAPPEGQEGYTKSDPGRAAFMLKPRTGVIEVEDFLPHQQLIRSEYYPIMAALGVTYGTCIVPSLSLRRYDLISLWRSGARPRLEPDLTELLQTLFPHIQLALKIHQALSISEERAQNAEAILNASSTASLLLSGSGQLLYMNEVAQRLASERDGILERNGRILPTDTGRQAEFSDLVTAAGSSWKNIDVGKGGALILERPHGKRPLQLLVGPFPVNGPEHSRRVLVLATDPDSTGRLPDAAMKQLYGLTIAEAEIANGLLTGFSPEGIAAIRGVSVGTVRSQIKSLLLKTDTRRQTDLVRLLGTLPKVPETWLA